jgi:hypothetical protein
VDDLGWALAGWWFLERLFLAFLGLAVLLLLLALGTGPKPR